MTDQPDRAKKTGLSTRDPWRVPALVVQIPSTGLHKIIEPSDEEAKALAALGGLRHATRIRGEFRLTPERADQVRVTGRVTGQVGQICVVTLDPVDNDIDENIDLVFAPPDQVAALSAARDENDDSDEDRPDPPEPIENGTIDLGRVASDALFLGVDPYPRKPGAVFEANEMTADPEDHPFAALKALKPDH